MTTLLTWKARLRLLGPARLRTALAIAALAATLLTLLMTLPAHAEPTPTPTAPAAPGQRTPTPEEMEEIEEILKEQGERLDKAAQEQKLEAEKERLRKLLPDEGGVLGVFNVTDANGLPISLYTVKSDTGGILDWDLGVQNLLTELCFMITKWVIAFCCWLIAWSLSFGLAKLLLVPVLSVANSLHARVIMEMGLPGLFLSVCALVCVARIFFGDKARGWGDAALSLLLAALTATLLASPPQALLGEETGAIAVARGFALEVADVILDANPATPEKDNGVTTPATGTTLSRPLTDALTDAFIVKPAMLLQYGRVFEGECAAAYADTRLEQLAFDRAIHARTDKIKKYTGYADFLNPLGWVGVPTNATMLNFQLDLGSRWAADHFGDPPMERFEEECVPGDASAAKKASLDKLGGAFFLLVAALIVSVLISALAGSFLVAQCGIAWDAIRGEPALIAGLIPGAGRAFLWDWAASVLHRLGQMLVSVIGLAVLILIIQAVLDPAQEDWGRELTLRFLIVDIVCIAAIKKRKALAHRSKQVASNFRAKLSSARIGGTHGSAFSPPATAAVPKNHNVGAKAARGLVRGTMAGVSLAHGNPLAAIGYAMPQSVGATALMSRLQSGTNRSRPRRPPRSARRPSPRSGTRPSDPGAPSTSPPSTPPPTPGDGPAAGSARPAGPAGPAGPTGGTGGTPRLPGPSGPRRPGGASSPRRPAPAAPRLRGPALAAAAGTTDSDSSVRHRPRRHIQAHRAVTRRTRPVTPPSRAESGPGGFDAWLSDREEQELRRRMSQRGSSR